MSVHVEFRDLKYIAAVAETSSFTCAAEGLYVAQPSLSKQIKDVEIETGVQIFERQREGVFPTPVGQMIVDYANATLAERKHVFRLAREISLGAVPPLKVGFSCFVNSRHLQSLRTLYEKHFPSCILQLSGGDTVHVLHRMERGDLDCALLQLPIEGPKSVVGAISPYGHIVAIEASHMRLIDVREYPEYAAEHIEGSELIPLGTLKETAEAWERAQPLRIVCRTGRRAMQAKQLLDEKGFRSVEVLHGGMEAWTSSGNAVLTAEHKPWAVERQVRVVAGSLVLAFVLLGTFVSRYLFAGAGLVGAGLVFAGVSNTCMMASVLGRMPWNQPKKVSA